MLASLVELVVDHVQHILHGFTSVEDISCLLVTIDVMLYFTLQFSIVLFMLYYLQQNLIDLTV